ncbi:T9SS type A sorting domain-containing protein [Flavobacterium sedimenticola]|uniref:T9SS type A sorting domain-containing protein n=1 Tax=Flavobacterium sedimenticola TaxID=3043286 RepID=A0ABT6XS67_9FLAO|nr:T9SS type A sorting domain-containing protein [Flavobacterium sedimenticola]MDI9257896.1 T9SS type A sorting domain-containing protein [Flavobacterium sedimenticola]
MKICILFLIVSCTTYCQPVLTSNNYFQIGDNILVAHKLDIELLDYTPGPSGQNIVWDFSGVNFEHPAVTTNSLSFIEPTGTPFYPGFMDADYSESNLCCLLLTEDDTSPSNNQYNYFKKDNDGVVYLGQWADNPVTELWNDQYINPINEISFPLTYGQTTSDTFERTYTDYSGGMSIQVNGNVTINADGYGTLITPDNVIINNVIRLHRTENGNVTQAEGSYAYQKQSFIWYAEDRRGFIIKLDMSINDPSQIDTADFNKSSSLGVVENHQNLVSVYPIPTNDFLNIQSNYDVKEVELYNASGSLIYRMNPVNNKLDTSNLTKGIYLVKTKLENGKVIITKITKN